MKTYEKYKPSGIDWIGDIPEHWGRKRLKFVSTIRTSHVDKKTDEDEIAVELCNYVDVYKNEFITSAIEFMKASASEAEIEKFRLVKGDVLITKDSETPDDIASPALIRDEFQNVVCGYHLAQIRSDNEEISGRFLFRLFQAKHMNAYFEVSANGVTRYGLPLGSITGVPVLIPKMAEQTAIANYLDKETARIDELVERKKRLIELLKEERLAIINHAVTRGLDPTTKLKPSNIEWLGDIPEHWDAKRLKFVANVQISNVDKKSDDSELPVFLCNYVDVYKNEFINGRLDFMEATANENEIKKFLVKKGDVMITKDSETADDIANPAVAVENLENVICGYHLAQIRPDGQNLIGEYLFRLFQSKPYNSYFEVAANGVTRYGMPIGSISGVWVSLPPVQEQERIVEEIRLRANTIDITVTKVEKEIGLLNEYRTALISEVVTGKIKVD